MKKCHISDTGIHRLRDEAKKYMALFPTDKVVETIDKILETVLDYLANDQEVRKFLVYIQSEEFPPIHTIVERLKEYKGVSTSMCMFLKPQSDGQNICSVSTGA